MLAADLEAARAAARDREVAVREAESRAAEREREQQQAAALLAADLEAARAAARDREVAVTESERRIAKLSEQHAAIKIALEDLNRERGQLAAALEEEKETAARNNAQAGLLRQELETLRSAVREHETAAAKLRADLHNTQSLSNDRKNEFDKLSRELKSAQSIMRDRDAQIDRLGRDADATRLFLRESQSEVQRLAGEVETARVEIERANAERQRVSDAFAIKSSELNLAHSRMELLQKELEELRVTTAKSPIMREEIAALKAVLEESRREANRRELRINELSRELQFAAAQAVRIRDLEGWIEEANVEKERLADELKRTAAEIHRVENSAANRVAALEAIHTAALAESENKAQAKIRSLRGPTRRRRGDACESQKQEAKWPCLDEAALLVKAPRRAPTGQQRTVRRRMVHARISGRRRQRPLAGRSLPGGGAFAGLSAEPVIRHKVVFGALRGRAQRRSKLASSLPSKRL